MSAGTFKSDFAILDVKMGRGHLKRRVEKGERVPVVIRGYVDAVHGQDDGVSREFSVEVMSVSVEDVMALTFDPKWTKAAS